MQNSVLRKHEPYRKLKALLVERNITQGELASLLDKSPSGLNQNLNGTGGDFTLSDVRKVCEFLQISSDDYFIDHVK